LIGGFSDPNWAVRYAPNLERFREPNSQRFWGAYGERIGQQLPAVVEKLIQDPYTRQAVITLWRPELDNQPGMLDYPCTIAIGFSIAGSTMDDLDMRVTMRSNDAWLGLPYDMFQFGQLQQTVANVLGLFPGKYTHTAWSMHLYQDNIEVSYKVTDRPVDRADNEVQPIGFGTDKDSIKQVMNRAHAVAFSGLEEREIGPWSESERWYLRALTI
jgi:thymidylate synthase